MGFNTTVLILNDTLSRIESDPEEFVKSLWRRSWDAYGAKRVRNPKRRVDYLSSLIGGNE